ncbi:uncharacterized protein [Littorina saxatilis]|uniref:uncharacterized protein n=1 Tax=Littorina saxatilis TaxID=31220 RepID=UPI0038B45016
MAQTGYTPLVLYGWQEWRSHVGGDRQQAVLLDGVWGEGRLQGDWWQTWGPLLQSLPQLMSQRKCVLVVTVYMHILKEIESADKTQDLLHHLPTVDLGSADPFSAKEKELMLINHVTHLNLSLDSHMLHDVIERDISGPFFPWYCEQLARQLRDKTAYHGNAEAGVSRADVFSSTALAYVGFFRAVVEDADSWRDLVPLLVLVMNGQSDVIGHVEDALTELSSLGVECEAGGVSTLPQLSLFLRGSVLSKDGEQFLTRDVYLGLGLALYAAGCTKLLLRACDGLFLVNHVTTHTTPRPPGLLITPTSPHYPAFLERVCGDLTRGRVVEIGQHPSLHHYRFLADLEVSLRNRRLLASALTVCDPDHHLPLLYWSAWTSPPSHVYSNTGSQAGLSLSQWCIKLCPQGVEEARVLRKTLLVCCLLGERVDSPRVADMLDKVCENTLLLNDMMSIISLPLPPAKHVLTQELRDRCDMFSTSRPPRLFCGEASMHEVTEADRCIPPSIISLEVEPAVRVKLTPRCVRWYTAYRLLSMCDVNETNRDGYTLLHTAAFTGDLGAVSYLTDRGCRVTAATHRGNTPFTKAVEANKVEVASHLLGTGHSLQELSGGRGVTACVRGVVVNRHADMLCLLLDHGALDFIRSCDQRGGVSLLRDARGVKQNDQVVSILKSHGVRSGQLTCCWSGH